MFTAGAAVSSAESRKISKYADMGHAHIFIQVAIETLGVWGSGATDLVTTNLVTALDRRTAVDSGDPQSTFILRQRVDIAIQKGNALSMLGTIASGVTSADLSFAC